MFSYSPNEPPICDVSYYGPLRQRKESPIHPYLHDVQIIGCDTRENRHQLTAAQGGNDTSSTKVSNINSRERNSNLTAVKHDVDNCQEPHQSPKPSTNVYPAPERAACVPDTRFQSVRDVLAEMAPTLFPSFFAQYGRKPEAGVDFDADGSMCQEDYEYFSGTGRYSNEVGNG